jgi:DNA-directed RNA polymerase subunit beta'
LAELVDDSCSVPTSGEIRYESIEVDDQRILTKPGKVYFVPEEIHQVSKDISLKAPNINSGDRVTAGTEIVKDIVCRTDGIVEIVEDNDIIHEVIIRPGDIFRVDDVSSLKVEDGTVVPKNTEVAPGIKTKERCMVTVNFQIADPDEDEDLEDTSGLEYADVLLRPVQEFDVAPRNVEVEFNSTDGSIMTVVPITQLLYRDGDKVRQIEGAPLLRTSLVLQMKGQLSLLKGAVETPRNKDGDVEQLRVVVLENLTIRRDVAGDVTPTKTSIVTQLLVEDGAVVKKNTPVIRTQVLARSHGQVSLGKGAGEREVRRILLITDDHETDLKLPAGVKASAGDFIRLDQALAKDFMSPVSGQIVKADKGSAKIRLGRPYLISPGSQLQVANRALVQRGDLVTTLIFERQKTGDIVQGLPRVEELLEGRKPKESAIVAPYEGKVEIVEEDDVTHLYLTSDNGRAEIVIPVGANILVPDKATVKSGQPLTDGSINPHDLLVVSGIGAVRTYLVDEVQRVYRSQGVEIGDKHIEVIVRQMTKKVRVDDSGETTLLPGELVDEKDLEQANKELLALLAGGGKSAKGKAKAAAAAAAKKAKAKSKASDDDDATDDDDAPAANAKPDQQTAIGTPVLLGITKASLNTDSFISAASFQETTRVLTEAAVEGKRDKLFGLKENVIIGRLIPAGTGFPNFRETIVEEVEEQLSFSARSGARKPSAILEEIESMFGSPEINSDSLGSMLLDDDEALSMVGVNTEAAGGGGDDVADMDIDIDDALEATDE